MGCFRLGSSRGTTVTPVVITGMFFGTAGMFVVTTVMFLGAAVVFTGPT